VSSIRNYLSGIRTVHQLLGFDLNEMNTFLVNFTLRGISRLKCHCVKQAEPITLFILHKMFLALDFKDSENLIYWCLFIFAFFLLARKSNLVPTTSKDLINHKCLLRSDVTRFHGNLIVTMNWSKTIQFGERLLQTPLLRLKGSHLCPVTAYDSMLKVVPGVSSDVLFLLPNGKPVTYYLFQNKLRNVLNDIGF
jgi:hypothetical protein